MRFSNLFSRLGVAFSACLLFALCLTLTNAKAFASAAEVSKLETSKTRLNRQYLTLDAMGAPHLAATPTAQNTIEIHSVAASGNDLYFGGVFDSIGGIAARGIARYNVVSGKWFPLGGSAAANGNGVAGTVHTITIVGTNIYVAGAFTGGYNNVGSFVSANCVARFNTTNSTWSALGTGTGANNNGFNGDVLASVTDGTNLYFVGAFKRAFNSGSSAVDVNNVACWNTATSTWSSLGKGIGPITDYEVYDVEIVGNDLYIGGRFPWVIRSDNYTLHVDCIARWNLTTKNWFPLGVDSGHNGTNGCGGDVYALETDGTTLFVGGTFREVNNSASNKPPASYVAKWNGTTWTTLNGATNVDNNGVDTNVTELCYNGGNLYVGGTFGFVKNTNGTQNAANHIARWNGTSWGVFGTGTTSDGNGVDDEVKAMAMVGGQLYVGGLFSEAYNNTGNTVLSSGLARWTGTVWTTLGTVAVKSVSMASAASFAAGETAAEGIMTAFGTTLATGVLIGNTLPLPTSLLNTTISVRDSVGTTRAANLFYVSPTQINFLVPSGTAAGTATVTVNSGDGSVSQGTINVLSVAPGLFTLNANGQGVVAAVALRVRANGSQSYENIATYDTSVTPNKWVTSQIDLGPTGERVFLILYGTGIRGKVSSTPMALTIGGVTAPISFAGPQGTLVGLDQINVEIPRSLIGRKEVDLVFTLGGKTANTVKVSIK